MSAVHALDVVTLGEAMALFIADQPGALSCVSSFSRRTAGAELNVAVGLSRLGFHVGYISRVGDDSLGQHLLDFVDAEGIDRAHITVDPAHPTGLMFKSLASDGSDPLIEYFRRGSAASHLGVADHPRAYCTASRHLHLTGISPALSEGVSHLVFDMAAQARREGRSISFDPNLRPRLWPSEQAMIETVNLLAAGSDLVMPGLAEGQLLTGRESPDGIADFYLGQGVKQVVIKLGAKGAYFADRDSAGMVTGFLVDSLVDTVGAGDGFAVGVISALLEGASLQKAAVRGNAIGARVVQFPGDSDGLPNRTQLAQALMAPRYGAGA